MKEIINKIGMSDTHKVYFKDRETNEVYHETEVEHGSKVSDVPAYPVKHGKTFVGWEPDIKTKVIYEETTFYAKWDDRFIKLTFFLNSSNGISFRFIPFKVIDPLSTLLSFRSKLVIVLLPQPLSPTKATIDLFSISKFTLCKTFLSLS